MGRNWGWAERGEVHSFFLRDYSSSELVHTRPWGVCSYMIKPS